MEETLASPVVPPPPAHHAPGTSGELVDRLRDAGCVYAEDEAALLIEAGGGDPVRLEALASARVSGEPLEQLLGWVAFLGLRLAVGPGVFVPRLRTELLAELAASMITDGGVAVELCCGVGAVAAALQRSRDLAELYAVDIDPEAVAYARRNVPPPAMIMVGDLYDPLPGGLIGRVDLVVANAPYVPSDAVALMPREARDHEPLVALDGGIDGVEVHRRIISAAPRWLRPGGRLLIETGRAQSAITAGEMQHRGFDVEVVVDDERDATVVVGLRA